MFLPNASAIEGLQELLNLNSFDLLNFTEGMVAGLSYHIVPGLYLAEDLQDGALLSTVEGQNIAVSPVLLNGATILHEDIEAFNGVIHVIDEVLVPPGYPAATTWDAIEQSPDHTFFEQALLAEGLKEALRGQPILNDNEPARSIHRLCPTDVAFEIRGGQWVQLEELLGSQFIDDIVRAHLVGPCTRVKFDRRLRVFVLQQRTHQCGGGGGEHHGQHGFSGGSCCWHTTASFMFLGRSHAFCVSEAEGTCGTIVMNSSPSDFGIGWQGARVRRRRRNCHRNHDVQWYGVLFCSGG